jgi:hypothetical protein
MESLKDQVKVLKDQIVKLVGSKDLDMKILVDQIGKFLTNLKKESEVQKNDIRKLLIQKILDDEFSNSSLSLNENKILEKHRDLIKHIIKYRGEEFLNFGPKIFEMTNKKGDEIHDHIFKRSFKRIKDLSTCNMQSLSFISLRLPELPPDVEKQYVLHASIVLDPSFSDFKISTNTSLRAYSKIIYIKYPSIENLMISFYEGFKNLLARCLPQEEERNRIKTVSFVVPFPQICKYEL